MTCQDRAKSGVQLGPRCWAALGTDTAPSTLFSQPPLLDGAGPRHRQGGLQRGSQSWARGGLLPVPQAVTPLPGRFSTDEGLTWSTYNFTDTSVFVDGLLSEPGEETLVIT